MDQCQNLRVSQAPRFEPSRHPRPVLVHDWRDAEEFAVWHATAILGFEGVVGTEHGADGGIDLRGDDVLGQVKFHAKPVGRPDIQRLVGAARSTRSIFYSLSGFTEHAARFAATSGIALFSFTIYGDASPTNAAAEALIDTAEERAQVMTLRRQALLGEKAAEEELALRGAAHQARVGSWHAQLESDSSAQSRAVAQIRASTSHARLARSLGNREEALRLVEQTRDEFATVLALLALRRSLVPTKHLAYVVSSAERGLEECHRLSDSLSANGPVDSSLTSRVDANRRRRLAFSQAAI